MVCWVSLLSILFLYALQRLQSFLPYSLGFGNVAPPLAFNTAASFVTNTSWQLYSPDVTLVGQLAFPDQANGSMIKNESGEVVGSSLIGQSFTDVDGSGFVRCGSNVSKTIPQGSNNCGTEAE